MKYNVGDKVRIKSLDWYNENKDEDGIVELSTHIFTPGMSQFCGKVVTIEDVFEDIDDNVVYYIEEIDYDWTDEMFECLVEEDNDHSQWTGLKVELELSKTVIDVSNVESLHGERFMSGFVKAIIPPEGYQFVDENGNVINAQKIVLERKKKEYPKTYEECCKVLGVSEFEYNHTGTKVWYRHKLMATLDKLMLCRDAYWKLYGEEMGLGKPWEPEYVNMGEKVYSIIRSCGVIKKNPICDFSKCYIFEFPTKEMRDAFYENFKELIETVKELL